MYTEGWNLTFRCLEKLLPIRILFTEFVICVLIESLTNRFVRRELLPLLSCLLDPCQPRSHVGLVLFVEVAEEEGPVYPGVNLVNLVVLMQFRWPECDHVRRGIEGRPEAIDRAPSPPGYVGNDIFDRPASCDLRLRHVLLTNLVEQCQPCRLLAL